MRSRVVVTGVGLVTPLGCGRAATWAALTAGQSGIGRLTLPELPGVELIGARVAQLTIRDYVEDMKAVKTMTRQTQLAVAAARMACDDAGATRLADGRRIGVYLGAGFEDTTPDEIAPAIEASLDQDGRFDMRMFGKSGYQRLSPLFGIRKLPNMALSHVSIAHGVQGPNALFSPSVASSAQAIAEGFEAVRSGRVDVALVGGCDAKLDVAGYLRYGAMKLLSPSTHAASASRPFDPARDGAVLGEGAAFLVLESDLHARARSAVALAEIAGTGAAFACPQRDQERAVRALCSAMNQALEEAQVTPDTLDYLQANGASTQLHDQIEREAIGTVLRERVKDVPVGVSKAALGHLVAGSGAVDVALAICALRAQTVPPVRNAEAAASGLRLASAAHRHPIRTALVNVMGFEGTYASVALRQAPVLG